MPEPLVRSRHRTTQCCYNGTGNRDWPRSCRPPRSGAVFCNSKAGQSKVASVTSSTTVRDGSPAGIAWSTSPARPRPPAHLNLNGRTSILQGDITLPSPNTSLAAFSLNSSPCRLSAPRSMKIGALTLAASVNEPPSTLPLLYTWRTTRSALSSYPCRHHHRLRGTGP